MDCHEHLLSPGSGLAGSLKSAIERVGAAQQDNVTLIGVGLAGTWLLGLSALGALASGMRLLALFPYLGVDPTPYGAQRSTSNWCDRWLFMARLPLLRPYWNAHRYGTQIVPTTPCRLAVRALQENSG